jgi:hypothetical protein
MIMRIYRCDNCGERFARQPSQMRCKQKFCSLVCFGVSRRIDKPEAQRKADKAAYDREYRTKNRALLKEKKSAYFRRTYDPEAARVARKKGAARHAEYCKAYYADPKRKAEKQRYDADRRATVFGPFSDAYKVYLLLKQRVLKQLPDKYERLKAMGYYDQPREKSNA